MKEQQEHLKSMNNDPKSKPDRKTGSKHNKHNIKKKSSSIVLRQWCNQGIFTIMLMISALCLSLFLFRENRETVFASEETDEEVFFDDDTSSEEDYYEDDPGYDDPGEDDPGEWETDPSYRLEVNRSNISFGKISKGDVGFEPVTISNKSTKEVYLNWTINDPDNAFYVDVNGVGHIDSLLGSGTVYVYTNSNASVGTHTANILFGDVNDVGFTYGVMVTVSCQITENYGEVYDVDISPTKIQASPGSRVSFYANVWADNCPDYSVSYSVSGNKSNSTRIDGSGVLTIGSDERASKLTIQATSNFDRSKYAKAEVGIVQNNFTVSVSANPGNAGNVGGGGSFKAGSSTTVSASANSGYVFTGWTINGRSVGGNNNYNIDNINENITAVANFSQSSVKVDVVSSNNSWGTVTGGGTIAPGGSMTLKASPVNDTYAFDYWNENGNVLSRDTSFQLSNITSDRKITAVFKKMKFAVSAVVSPVKAGNVSGTGVYARGGSLTLTAAPAAGFTFGAWMKDGRAVSTTATINISNLDEDQNLVAAFVPQEVKTVDVEAGTSDANGVITPTGRVKVGVGQGVTFAISPKAGYQVANVTVDGKSVGALSAYTFTNVASAHKIVASFAPIPGQKPAENKPSSGTPSDGHVVKDGEKVTIDDSKDVDYGEHIIEDPAETTGEGDGTMHSLNNATGVFQHLNILPEEARQLIERGQDMELLVDAYESGYLAYTINNAYSDSTQLTSGGIIDYMDDSLKVFFEIADEMLGVEEKMRVFSGERISYNLSIFANGDFIQKGEKQLLDNAAPKGSRVGEYFSILLMEMNNGDVSTLGMIPRTIELTIKVPDNLKGKGDYRILRNHEGELTILEDMDNNPDTITFVTDRFSTYGILVTDNGGNNIVLIMAVVLAVAVLISIIVGTVVMMGNRRSRRR